MPITQRIAGALLAATTVLVVTSSVASESGPSEVADIDRIAASNEPNSDGFGGSGDDFDEEDFEDDEGFDLDLEDLMQIEVTSVAGVARPLASTPSAIHVITNEDLRRSGHRTIAEALRLVPGVFVGRNNSSVWSVGSRGFGSRFANKLLVLIDGRVVYDPLFSGTYWDVQDTLFEDVDRIEVINGPGATLWGANAVNGVINVVSRSARETQGIYISGGGGSEDHGFGAIRFGGQLDDATWFRVWGKFDEHDITETAGGVSSHDDWSKLQGGFRFDIEGDDDLDITLGGEAYRAERLGSLFVTPVVAPVPTFNAAVSDDTASGGHLRMRVARDRETTGWSVKTYYDYTTRAILDGFRADRDTIDVEFRHYFQPWEDNQLIWGAGYRYTADTTTPTLSGHTSFSPASRADHTVSAFVQDTITLVDDTLFSMIGSKFEHNDYTGVEIQPSARVWWTPNEKNTVWASASRAVRVPSRSDHNISLVTFWADPGLLAGGPALGQNVPFVLAGDDNMDSEELLAFEAGWRRQLTDTVSFDLALFYNDYDRLNDAPSTGGMFNNEGQGETYGGEISATWKASDNWRLFGSYAAHQIQIHNPNSDGPEQEHPHHQFQVRSYLDLFEDVEFNAAVYFVDRVTAADDYLRFDLGVTWYVTPNFELAIWGQNLLDGSHPEAFDPFLQTSTSEIERAVYLQGTLRF